MNNKVIIPQETIKDEEQDEEVDNSQHNITPSNVQADSQVNQTSLNGTSKNLLPNSPVIKREDEEEKKQAPPLKKNTINNLDIIKESNEESASKSASLA